MTPNYRSKVSAMLGEFRKLNERMETFRPEGAHDSIRLKEIEKLLSEFESASMDLASESRGLLKSLGWSE